MPPEDLAQYKTEETLMTAMPRAAAAAAPDVMPAALEMVPITSAPKAVVAVVVPDSKLLVALAMVALAAAVVVVVAMLKMLATAVLAAAVAVLVIVLEERELVAVAMLVSMALVPAAAAAPAERLEQLVEVGTVRPTVQPAAAVVLLATVPARPVPAATAA